MEPSIDAHAHVWTDDLEHYPLARGFTRGDMNPPSFTAAKLLEICRPSGVGRVNLIQMSYYAFDNIYMIDMIGQYPDRFIGTAIVDPLGADPAGAMRALFPRGVRAFRIQPQYSKQPATRWLEPAGYNAMFALAASSRAPLSCLVDPDGFTEIDRMCKKHPRAPLIIDHLGRIGASGAIRGEDVEALCGLAEHLNVYVKVGAFYALGEKKPPYHDLIPLIRRVVQAFTPQRLMWESDCPFQVMAHRYEDSIQLIRDLDFLSPDDRQWLLGKTAREVLFRPLAV